MSDVRESVRERVDSWQALHCTAPTCEGSSDQSEHDQNCSETAGVVVADKHTQTGRQEEERKQEKGRDMNQNE